MERNDNAYEIDLKQLFRVLISNWLIITIVALVFAAGMFSYTKYFVDPIYETTVSMYVNNYKGGEGEAIGKVNYTDINAAQMLVSSYATITTSNSVLEEVSDRLNTRTKYSVAQIRGMVNTQIVEDTEIFQITVKNSNPKDAYQIANAMAEIVPKVIPEYIESSSVKVIDKAVMPLYPSSPNLTKNAIMGFVFGFLLSSVIVFLRVLLDRRVKTAEDLSNRFELPVLGTIPEIVVEAIEENK